jgi:hypothetical protein
MNGPFITASLKKVLESIKRGEKSSIEVKASFMQEND